MEKYISVPAARNDPFSFYSVWQRQLDERVDASGLFEHLYREKATCKFILQKF